MTMRLLERQRLRFFFLGVCTFVAASSQNARLLGQGTTDVLAQTGQTASDGNGTYSTLTAPSLNDKGQAAFWASLTGTSGLSSDDTGIFRGSGGSITQIAREGQIAPDLNGTYSGFASPVLNAAGQAGFFAVLTGTSGATSDNLGIFRGSGGSIIQITRKGQAAPDGNGTYFSFGNPTFNDSGLAAFSANLIGTSGGLSDNTGIFRGSGGSIIQIAREGQAAPDGNGTFNSFGNNTTINGTGQTAFFANLIGTSDITGIFRGSGGNITQVARAGQAAPDGNGTFSSFGIAPTLNSNGQAAFFAGLVGTSGVLSDNTGIFRGNGGSITQIAREGQAAPDGNGTYFSFGNPTLNDIGQAAFSANLIGTSGVSSDNTGIFRGSGGSIIQIAREGQIAPDLNGTYGSFGSTPTLNNAGQAVFTATLTGTSGGSADDRGIFTSDGIDSLQVAREGDSLAGSTITDLFVSNNSLNELGQVAYQASLSNGEQVLARWTPDLRWRDSFSSYWDSSSRWTLGIAPDFVHDVFIDPEASLTVTGPWTNTTVNSLFLGGRSGLATLNLSSGATLTVNNGFTIDAVGTLTGDGKISGDVFNSGTLLAQNVTVENGTLNNNFGGVIRGTGRVHADIDNWSSGEIRVGSGEQLRLTGNSLINRGKIEVIGGELEVTANVQNNSSTGLITGRNATMRFNGGVNNDGSMGFSFGTSDVSGDIANNATGVINISGGANVTFYDDVVQNGTMQIVSVGNTNSAAVFFGALSGSGGFSGGGDVFALGDLRPGNSPASVLMDGNLYLGATTNSLFELAGLGVGEFDQLLVTGDLALDGNLSVALLNGFQLTYNDEFLIADVGGILAGEFSGLSEGDLVGNYSGMDLFITYAAGSGNDVALFTAVPEPSVIATCLLALAGALCHYRRTSRASSHRVTFKQSSDEAFRT